MTSTRMALEETTAADLMTRDVLFVHPAMGVRELADFLAENEISGVPVIDAEGKLAGVVSATDIAQKSGSGGSYTLDQSDPRFFVRSFDDRLDVEEMRNLHIENDELIVRDIMTPKVFTVAADTPAAEIAQEMVSGRIHRVFVTNLEGRVVGIVSALDLLKLLAEPA